MATKNSCATLMLAVVAAVSLNTAVLGQKVSRSGNRSSKVTVRRDQAPSRTANIHDHRKEAPSGTNIHDHRTKTPSGTNIHDHRNSPGTVTPPRRPPPPRVPGPGKPPLRHASPPNTWGSTRVTVTMAGVTNCKESRMTNTIGFSLRRIGFGSSQSATTSTQP